MAGEQAHGNRQAIVQTVRPIDLAYNLRILHQAGLLTGPQAQANREAFLQATNDLARQNMIADLPKLHNAGLLAGPQAQANRQNLLANQELLHYSLHVLPPHLITQVNIDALILNQINLHALTMLAINHQNPLISAWINLPPGGSGSLTQAHFDALVGLAQQHVHPQMNNQVSLTGKPHFWHSARQPSATRVMIIEEQQLSQHQAPL